MRNAGWLGRATAASAIAATAIMGFSALASSQAIASQAVHAKTIVVIGQHATPDGPPWGP